MARRYPRSFYASDTVSVARELLGATLVRRMGGEALRGRIVETEAYVGEEDLACHARAGRTPRTEVMYGPPGFAYVYLTYGMHHLLNVVTEPEGRPAAVLIRAVEPLRGIEQMARARGLDALHLLASGPAKLCQAFGLDLAWNRADLCRGDLTIEPGSAVLDAEVETSPRIGCERVAKPWGPMPWRFYVAGSPHVTPGRAVSKLLVTSARRIGNNQPSLGARDRSARNTSTRR